MHLKSRARFSRLPILFIPILMLAGCFGEGDGQPRILGTPKAPLVGVLVDSPVSGVEWQTTTGTSGLTTSAGEFEYQAGDRVTFAIGTIVLGTAPGAPVITAVELTGSNVPTDRAALNLLIFLQSIDADADPANGITVSPGTRSLAQGQTLDFSSPDFATRVGAVVAAIANGNSVVSETDALLHFYETYLAFGGTDTFNFLFPGFPPVGGGVGFELVFSDEFNSGTAPSPEKWNIETGYGPGGNGWGNNEWQLYTDSAENVRVEDGNLVISALCSTPPCGVRDGSVTSGRINTLDKFEFRYGKVIARIKPPVGEAAWPAFWSLGANFPDIGWPRSGEIDFMEIHNEFSDDRTSHFTVHWCDQSIQAPLTCSFPDGWVFDSQQTSFPNSLGDDFHIFEADWDANRIIGKIDGVTYFTREIDPATMEEFQRDFFLILNVAMGGTLGSNSQPPDGTETFPQTMLVDYVRVFQKIGGEGPAEFSIDFENAPESYDFGVDGGFGGGAAAVVANPFPGGINSSAQVARMLKFQGEVFAGSLLTLDTPLEVAAGTSFSMKVYSQRPVDVLFKLEGEEDAELRVVHGGTGWEELTFNAGSFSSSVSGISFIFDLGIVGDAAGDPENWTFYFDDIVMIPPDVGGPALSRIDLPITFEDPLVDYTLIDFGEPVPVTTTLVLDPFDDDNIVASTTKPPGAPLWAGTTMSTEAGLASPIPFSDMATTIGMRVFSPDAGIPVRLKAENSADPNISVETEVFTKTSGRWETLVFDFSAQVEGPALDTSAVYDTLSVFFNFGTDGNTAGEKTYLWDDVEFGVPLPVVDVTPPTLSSVRIRSSNANPAVAVAGDTVTVTFTASEAIVAPVVTIAGEAATVTGAGATWQATRVLSTADPEGPISFTVAYSDLAGNAGVAVSTSTDGSGVITDLTPPAVALLGAPAAFTTLDPVSLTVQFSEAVSGFVLTDLAVTNGVAQTLSNIDGATYTVDITPNGAGDLGVAIAAGAAVDAAGNPSLPASSITISNELDADAPRLTAVSITSNNPNPEYAGSGDVVTITMTASEEIAEPTVTIAGAPADSVGGTGTTWVAHRTIASAPEGLVSFAIEFEDLGGNAGPRSTVTTDSSSVIFDTVAPAATITGLPAVVMTLDPITVMVVFDEDVMGFALGDIVATNALVDGFAVLGPDSYSVEVTPSGGGDVGLSIAADVATDLAGNGNAVASATATLDTSPFWQLLWADEFDAATLDTGTWSTRSDADCPDPCEGLQGYRTNRVGVAGGVLLLEARDDGTGPIYTSGLIDTRGKRELRYGRVEIDARMPGTVGVKPTLWLAPATDAYGPWPLSGEIDIVDAPNLGSGGATTVEHTLHYGLPEPEDTVATVLSPAPAMATSAFSTYAIEWEAGEVRWFVDGAHVATQSAANWYTYHEDSDGVYTLAPGAAPFDEDFYLVLSLAVTGSGGVYPQTLEIESVRVYECANATDPAAGTGCAGVRDAVDPGVEPFVVTPPPYNAAPFTDMIVGYSDAPANVEFVDSAGMTMTAALRPETFTTGAAVVSSTIDAADGANVVWSVNVAASSGSAGVSLAPDLGSSTGYFDLTGGETAGELLFRMRVNSASGDPELAVRLDSGTGVGAQALSYTADGTWQQYSVKIADLVADSVMAGTSLNLASITNLFMIEASGGSVDFDLDDISVKVACREPGVCEATGRFTTAVLDLIYGQDFESLDQASATALAEDGWLVFGNVYQPDGTTYIYGYGVFDAPNGGPGFSAIDTGQGGDEQGAQQLSIYSDYDNADQMAGNQVEANVFKEWRIGTGAGELDLVGKTIVFSFDAKRGNINDPGDVACMDPGNPCNSTAVAFVKTLDASFATTNFEIVDMTTAPDTWNRYSISLDIDAGLDGQLLQIGFYGKASNFEPSGVFYDNIVFESGPTPAP